MNNGPTPASGVQLVDALPPELEFVSFAYSGGGSCAYAPATRIFSCTFPSIHFDFLSMGYALRHVPDLRGAFAEYRRVLKPGGIVLLLEISRPRSALLLHLSRFYIKHVLGAAFTAGTGRQDMKTLMAYWWETTEQCVPPETIVEALKETGFQDCTVKEWLSGLLRDYRAVKGSDQL